MANAPRYQQQPSQRRQEPQAPETPKSSAPVLAPEPAPKASAEPAIVSQFVAPDTHVLARWKGPGKFSGVYYSLTGEKKPHASGTVEGYFDAASVKKLHGHFEAL